MLEASDVGSAMERLRGDRTQREVAKRAGINRSSWSSYEAGRRMPGAETWRRIVHGLQCTEHEFDQAVQHAWRQRLADGRHDDGARRVVDLAAGPDAVALSSAETLDLAALAERLHSLSRRILRRREESD